MTIHDQSHSSGSGRQDQHVHTQGHFMVTIWTSLTTQAYLVGDRIAVAEITFQDIHRLDIARRVYVAFTVSESVP